MSKAWNYYNKLKFAEGTLAECRIKIQLKSGAEEICGRTIGTKSTTALWNHLKLHSIEREAEHSQVAIAQMVDKESKLEYSE